MANNLAWLLATHPDAALRDGEEAVRLGERAAVLTGDAPEALDTLAAAVADCPGKLVGTQGSSRQIVHGHASYNFV